MSVKVNDDKELILVRESLAESVARDAVTFATIGGLVAIGVALDSSALQWVGALMGFAAACVRASGMRKRCTYTIAEARKRLDELEAAQ